MVVFGDTVGWHWMAVYGWIGTMAGCGFNEFGHVRRLPSHIQMVREKVRDLALRCLVWCASAGLHHIAATTAYEPRIRICLNVARSRPCALLRRLVVVGGLEWMVVHSLGQLEASMVWWMW